MGNKGIFFACIAFLLIIAILAVSFAISQSASEQSGAVAEQSAFDSANNRFSDIYNRTISIKTGERGKIQGRILPFTYDSGTDWFSAEQYLPLTNAPAIYEGIFDALNLYEIFSEDSAISREYSTGITAQQNYCAGPGNCWGGTTGTTPKFTSVMLPQCLAIEPADPEDESQFLLKAGTTTEFDYCPASFPAAITDAIETMEITLKFSSGSEIQPLQCSGSFSGCPDSEFIPADFDAGKPYAIVHLIAPDCIAKCGTEPNLYCCISSGEQTIAANIDTGLAENSVSISLAGGGSIKVDFKNLNYPGEIVKIKETGLATSGVISKAKVTFVNSLQELRFNGFESLSVSRPNFDITRKSS